MSASPSYALLVLALVVAVLAVGGFVLVFLVVRGRKSVALGAGIGAGILLMVVIGVAWWRVTADDGGSHAGAVEGALPDPAAPESREARVRQWQEAMKAVRAWSPPPPESAAAEDFFPSDVGGFRLESEAGSRAAEYAPPRVDPVPAEAGPERRMVPGFVGTYRDDAGRSVALFAFRLPDGDESGNGERSNGAGGRDGSDAAFPYDEVIRADGWAFAFRHSVPEDLPAFAERYFHRLPGARAASRSADDAP